MNTHNRKIYIVRWECGIADDWRLVGAYATHDKAIEEGKKFLERNTNGDVYIEPVILPAR